MTRIRQQSDKIGIVVCVASCWAMIKPVDDSAARLLAWWLLVLLQITVPYRDCYTGTSFFLTCGRREKRGATTLSPRSNGGAFDVFPGLVLITSVVMCFALI